ncbi:MAG: cytochrome-c oxidase, cbb3-type subunit II, partial [Pedobacter sp.]
IYRTTLYSQKLASFHFWIGTLGILFYAVPMYYSGFVQGLLWKEFTPEGLLRYPNFLETTIRILPMHILRSIGGAFYLSGVIVMAYNLAKTMKAGKLMAQEPAEALPLASIEKEPQHGETRHRILERKPMLLLFLSMIVILIGGVIEMVPTFFISSNVPTIASVKPYTPLELQGRDLYIREGCVNCHSQTVRPFRSETERYGEYSKAGEFVYDHPFLWGSKRTGPDLHRQGGKYSNAWQYNHLIDPRSMSPGSIMPDYYWLADQVLDTTTTASKINAMRTLGVPYATSYEHLANQDLDAQAKAIAKDLAENKVKVSADKEIIAIIAYLQRLGTDIKASK